LKNLFSIKSLLGWLTVGHCLIFLLLGMRLQACAEGEVLNDFEEGGCNEIKVWKKSPLDLPFQALQGARGDDDAPASQSWYGWVTWTASTDEMRLLSQDFRESSMGNWFMPAGESATRHLLRLDQATTSLASFLAGLRTQIKVADGSGAAFTFTGPVGVAKSRVASVKDWDTLLCSLTYAANLGLDLHRIAWVSLNPLVSVTGQYPMAYDHLSLDNDWRCPGIHCPPYPDAKPNSPLPSSAVSGTSACDSVQLTWAIATNDGTDPISGYHLFRSNTSTGPWKPMAYEFSNSHTDTEAAPGDNYYLILPFASHSAFYAADYLRAQEDPLPGSFGVHEALLPTGSVGAGPYRPLDCGTPLATVTPALTESPSGNTETPTPSPEPIASPTSSAPLGLPAASTLGASPVTSPSAAPLLPGPTLGSTSVPTAIILTPAY
jgi:hypothetical protein